MSLIFKFIFLGIILFKIINCVIDEIGKSLELSECFLYLLHHVCPSEKIIGNKIRTDKLSALQIINIFKIFRESLGSCFHEVLSHYRKIFFEFGVFYNGDILFHIVINGLADSFLTQTFLTQRTRPLPFNLLLALSAEEECMGEHGMRTLLPQLGRIDMAIVGEPTGMQAAVGERGLVVLDCEGKTVIASTASP